MDYFKRLKSQIQLRVFFSLTSVIVFLSIAFLVAKTAEGSLLWIEYGFTLFIALVMTIWISSSLTDMALEPLHNVWRALVHVSPQGSSESAPDLKKLGLGQELISNMILQIYQLASSVPMVGGKVNKSDTVALGIDGGFPLPILAVGSDMDIIFANEAALKYLGLPENRVENVHLYSVMDMSFSNEHTFDSWLQNSRSNTATSTDAWHRVRIVLNDDNQIVKQFDMAAAYSKDNTSGAETILTIFDRTEEYGQDDEGLSFVALAVHELRTPLTMLRGFLEVFEEELGDKLDVEMLNFMQRMQASAQQLAAFVNNILNVARVDDDQLELQLSEGNWDKIIHDAIDNMSLRTQVHGKKIELTVDPNLPPVAVDSVSIYEVLSNLIDNAVKYSGNSKKITIHSYLNHDGLVETSVHDDGVGIPTTVMPHLFEKFQRNHRNRAQIGGTGLGLYLCKAIIAAHGGNIWIQSKEGEGSTFTFTVQPYSMLADEQKNGDNKEITRSAHGWIKNHSLYRR